MLRVGLLPGAALGALEFGLAPFVGLALGLGDAEGAAALIYGLVEIVVCHGSFYCSAERRQTSVSDIITNAVALSPMVVQKAMNFENPVFMNSKRNTKAQTRLPYMM